MSGGHFDYDQYKIRNMWESIQSKLERQGTLKDKDELLNSKEYYDNHPEEKFNYTYPEEVQKEFKNAIKYLKIAEVYAQRVDYLISGDDGEESFLKRLKEDLSKIK